MIGDLKYRYFTDAVFQPFIGGMFEAVLRRWSPQHADILEPGLHCGKFTLEDSEERFVKNIRMSCKFQESRLDGARQKKFLAGLSKCGYWVPLVGWENEVLGFGTDVCVGRGTTASTVLKVPGLRGACQFLWQRFGTGQAILDEDIQALANRRGDRDANRTSLQLRVRLVLMQCPAHVITLPLLGSFCSPAFAALKSRTRAIYGPARQEVAALFEKMEEWHLGRVLGAGENLAFQKLHAGALPAFARDLLQNDFKKNIKGQKQIAIG
jgi:hypothetical protein